MEVILKKDVEHLGKKNELVTVKPGYGRNYLIPQGFAILATDRNKRMREELVKQAERRQEKVMEELQDVVKTLHSKVLQIGAKVGQGGKIFGSITNVQLAEAIKKQLGIELDRKKITIPDDVKMLGTYKASVALHKDLNVDVDFEVIQE